MKLHLVLAALAFTPAAHAQVEPTAPPSRSPPPEVVQWVRKHSVPVGAETSAPDAREAAAIRYIVAGARVIGFGESGHGNHGPLAYRNRLIRHLAEHEGLSAVALESGLAESRQLYDYVLGGDGDAAALTQTGLTHGFGYLPENLALVRWLRAYNLAHPRRPVHLYGIDRSTIQSAPPGAKGYGIVLDQLLAYLAQTVPDRSAEVRVRVALFARRFTEIDYPAYTAAERSALDAALAEVTAVFKRERPAMVRASSAERYDWMRREAYDAAQLPAVFAGWVNDPADLAGLFKLIELRDSAMADHVRWAIAREGPKARILLFQANGHIATDTLVGSVMRRFPRQPDLTGDLLRRTLGPGYVAIATVSSRGRSASDSSLGSIDRAFATAETEPALLNLHTPNRSSWWDALQSASQGPARVDDMIPVRSFDAFLYLPVLTALPPPRAPGRGS